MSDELVKAHLLVVDDDDLLRGIAVKSLRHAGFEVTEASSGEDALAKFAAHAYDLLVLDLVMRGIDGYAVCRQLRATTHGAHIPILILTGLNDTDSIELAYRSGATDFITKPINWTLFSHRVRYALRASRSDEEIRRSRESLARAQRLARMGSWAIFPDGRMEFSAQLLRMLGTTGGARPPSCASAFLAHVQAADRERVNEARTQLAEYGTPYELEFQLVCFDGTVRTVFEQGAQLLDDQGRAIGVEGITQDITERVRAQKRIRQLAYYDSVTGLPNRQFLEVLAVAPLHRAARTRTSCAVLHVDIDRFKGVNDAFGRTQGDAVLKAVASRLRAWIRGSDFVSTGHGARDHVLLARVGSNAFTILIADLAGQDQAAIVAQRLLAALAQPMQVNSQSLVLTASMGIAFYPNDAHDLPGL
ncbi:MAG: diguanylate cyclase, partial [Burkholderiaceae bacterium]